MTSFPRKSDSRTVRPMWSFTVKSGAGSPGLSMGWPPRAIIGEGLTAGRPRMYFKFKEYGRPPGTAGAGHGRGPRHRPRGGPGPGAGGRGGGGGRPQRGRGGGGGGGGAAAGRGGGRPGGRRGAP